MRLKISLLVVAISLGAASVYGQKSTSSPFSRFGYGELAQKTLCLGQAMGNTGIGTNSSKHLNFANPASFRALDSGSFIMEFGAKYQDFRFSLNNTRARSSNSNMEYFAAAFPLCKWWKVGVGLLPFSRIGYSYVEKKKVSIETVKDSTSGNGGFYQVVFANAISPIKNLSLGVNVEYLFGQSEFFSQNEILDNRFAYTACKEQMVSLSGFLFEAGAQYEIPFDKSRKVVVGVLFVPEQKFNYNNEYTVYYPDEDLKDTIDYSKGKATTDFPMKIGGGASFHIKNKLIAAFDYSVQDWKDAIVFGKQGAMFTQQQSLNAGLQFTPDRYASKGYFKRVSYRCGARYEDSYINILSSTGEKYPVREYAVSVGFGLPLRQSQNNINVSVETGMKRTSSSDILQERFTKLNLNFTLHDNWFYKRKIN